MKRYLAIVLLAAVFLATSLSVLHAADSTPPASSRVVLILVPNLRWEDITETSTPTLTRLAREGAVGDINTRSRTRLQGAEGSPLEGALTVSAGTWASPAPEAPAAYSADEPYQGGTAAEAYRRTTGIGIGNDAIAFLGMPMTQRYNNELSFEVVLGTLGEAIVDAGGATVAIGNSDVGYAASPTQLFVRPAALAAMDTEGRVNYGDVSPRVLKDDPTAPYGIATDVDAVADALDDADRRLARSDGPAFFVLDPGDSYRAVSFAPFVSDDIAQLHHRHALEAVDELAAIVEERLPEDGTLIVASQVSGQVAESVEGFGPVIVSGPGWSGYLTSPSTHRTGIVTNLDLTATVLDLLGVEQPVNVIGNAMSDVPSSATPEERAAHLQDLTATAESVDSAKFAVINGFIAITLIIVLVSTIVLLRARHWRLKLVNRWVWTLERLLLLVLTVPLASWLMFAFVRWPSSAEQATVVFLVVAFVVWFAALLVERIGSFRLPVAALCLATTAVILVDQWLGAPLSLTSFFGHSPLLGARYYGLGNEASAALVGSVLVGLAFLFDQWPQSPAVQWGRSWGIVLAGLVVVGTAAAPFLGANVGVAVWGVVGFALAWAQMNGRKVTWRLVVVGLLIVGLLITIFSLIDLSGSGQQTHLGRAWTSASAGGVGELGVIVARKAQTNLRVLTHTNWAYVLIAILAFLGVMRWRPQGDFAATLGENPYFSSAMSACLVAGLAAFFTEDSGIVIPAIIVVYVGVGVLYLMLARLPRVASSEHAEERSAA